MNGGAVSCAPGHSCVVAIPYCRAFYHWLLGLPLCGRGKVFPAPICYRCRDEAVNSSRHACPMLLLLEDAGKPAEPAMLSQDTHQILPAPLSQQTSIPVPFVAG